MTSETIAAAPGRVNLIGEHTDYNGGYVLPTALPQETTVALTKRSDRVVRAYSAELGDHGRMDFELGREQRTHTWIDYVQGVTWALADRGRTMTGCEIRVKSNVPIGKGLSSSAALEVAVGRALNAAFGLGLSDLDIAMVSHRAETEFVGAPVGIMDQMVCSLGDRSTALFLDATTRRFEKIPLPPDAELAVIDSGIEHAHASGEYRTRRRECDEAAQRLGVGRLRDITRAREAEIEQLPEPLNRRARHVITENARVLSAVDAIRRNDVHTLGTLFLQSHASMRDDFQVSLPDIDRLVEIAAEHPDTLGARLTGGGFGGAVVVLCRRARASDAARQIVDRYRTETRRAGAVLLPEMT